MPNSRTFWGALGLALAVVVPALVGFALIVGPGLIRKVPVPAYVCSPPVPGSKGKAECLNIHPLPRRPEPTRMPEPTVFGLKCPDGERWGETGDGAVRCVPQSPAP